MLALLLAVSGCLARAAQDPLPRHGAEPSGIVLDEQGNKLAGAKVALRCDLERSQPWSQALQQLLQATPLPTAITDKDGEFVLPLARDQRRLGLADEGWFTLVVEQPGYQRWCEYLQQGVAGYAGSRVVLYRLDERDRIKVTVAPRAGLQLQLQIARLWSDDPDPGEVLPVPETGTVSVLFPLVPSPRPALHWTEWLPLGYRARLIEGTRTSAWQPIDPGATTRMDASLLPPIDGSVETRSSTTRLSAVETIRVPIRVTDKAGKPIVAATVLVPNDGRATLACAAASTDQRGIAQVTMPRVRSARVRAVADGFECAEQTKDLDELIEPVAPLQIQLDAARCKEIRTRDGLGAPVPFVHLELILPEDERHLLRGSRFGVVTDSEGRARLQVREGLAVQLVHEPALQPRVGPALADQEPTMLEVPRLPWVQVLVPFAVSNPDLRYQRRDGSWAQGTPPGVCGLLLRGLPDGGNGRALLLDDGTLLRARHEEIRRAPRSRDLATLDRRSLVGSIMLTVRGPNGKPLVNAAVFHSLEWMVAAEQNRQPRAIARTDERGLAVLSVRDLGERSLMVVHAAHCAKELGAPAMDPSATGKGSNLEITLERGAELNVRYLPAQVEGHQFLAVRLHSTQRRGDTELVRVGLELPRTDGKPQTAKAGHALPPGEYVTVVTIGKQTFRRTLKLTLDQPCLLDLTSEK